VVDQFPQALGGGERVAAKTLQLLPHDHFRCSLITFGGEYDFDILRAAGVAVHLWPLSRTWAFEGIAAAVRLARFARREHVNIVQTFFETSDLWAGPIVKLASGAHLIWSRRDLGILRGPKHRVAYRFLSRYVDRVIAVSQRVRQFTVEQDDIPLERVQTIYNSVSVPPIIDDGCRIALRQRLGLDEADVAVTTVANVRHVKGFDVLLECVARLRPKHSNIRLFVAGAVSEREYFAALQRQAHDSGITDVVSWLGVRDDVPDLLSASDIFVLPSRSEGFSNALLEAMAAGLPCIATNVGGNAEAITDGADGYIVCPEDVQAMTARLGELLGDAALRKALGSRARHTVQERFSDEQMIRRLMRLYDELAPRVSSQQAATFRNAGAQRKR
jgi:glycosyltransferase involved in cell wall biosynthesis